ncbi:MAG: ABC transporter ATP-binding protein [Candidatus Izemoplasmatales bacterium]|jgi:putative ABC transport system ATP-binding protein|nr:ABC transporter ATP-binding protein [Candidatus Izemoplasmatales bacterium]MDD4987775.1 ABC transporter ATP-binding protein [Candidatus Izemoplasmatales bacterium]MDY0373869.1 ABC transporter ATP-binding protein [Candidatus Izemoplasmatales bacterium]NLF49091.1 ABC transporter ATP-binding protein [Acholeplasmataceae bacterium]
MTLIKAIHLSKDYQVQEVQTPALRDVNLSIEDGDFCGIIGPSGSGKSTLLYCLSGLEKPSSGQCLVMGKDLSEYKETEIADLRQSTIGFVFQFYNLVPNLTVFENMLFPQIVAHKIDEKRVEALLELVNMAKYRNYFPNQLSGGMQQRVAIARAIVNEPKIIFADEPTGNLDSKSGREVMELLSRLNLDLKITVILVTHNPDHLDYCSRKIELRDGSIVNDQPESI